MQVHQSTHAATLHSLVNNQASRPAQADAASTGSAWTLETNNTIGIRSSRPLAAREMDAAKPKKH